MEYSRVQSQIMFYLLQDGCIHRTLLWAIWSPRGILLHGVEEKLQEEGNAQASGVEQGSQTAHAVATGEKQGLSDVRQKASDRNWWELYTIPTLRDLLGVLNKGPVRPLL